MHYEEKESTELHAQGYGSYTANEDNASTQGYGVYSHIDTPETPTPAPVQRENPYGAYINIADLKLSTSSATSTSSPSAPSPKAASGAVTPKSPTTTAQTQISPHATEPLQQLYPQAFQTLGLQAELDAVAAILSSPEGVSLVENTRTNSTHHTNKSSSSHATTTSTDLSSLSSGLPSPSQNHLHFNWLVRFQTALNEPRLLSRRAALTAYAKQFQTLASKIASVLADDYDLPNDKKTYAPASVGGVAGGTKYIVDGILFKFVTDPVLSVNKDNGARNYLYGGVNTPNIEFASKAASCELKAANEYFRFIYQNHYPVLVPMQMLIDVGGHRVVAMPLLPLKDGQLVYGSGNGGASVLNSNPIVSQIMRSAGVALHLASHPVGTVTLSAPGDVEVHVGSDKLLYLVDLGRIFPPEAVDVMVHLPIVPSAIFFRLLRPEFLRYLQQQKFPPVSSDAFSRWGSAQALAFNTVARNASKLFVDRVRQAAAELEQSLKDDVFPLQEVLDAFLAGTPSLKDTIEDNMPSYEHDVGQAGFDGASFIFRVRDAFFRVWRKANKSGRCPEDIEFSSKYTHKFNVFLLSLQISEWCHSRGISLRHLGLLRHCTSNPKLREYLLRVMTTRTLKALLREHLSRTTTTANNIVSASPPASSPTSSSSSSSSSSSPSSSLPSATSLQVRAFLHTLLTPTQLSSSSSFWGATLPRALMSRFGGIALSESERKQIGGDPIPPLPIGAGSQSPLNPTTSDPDLNLYALIQPKFAEVIIDIAARSGVTLNAGFAAFEPPVSLITTTTTTTNTTSPSSDPLNAVIDTLTASVQPRVKKLVFLDLIEAQNLCDSACDEISTSLLPVNVPVLPTKVVPRDGVIPTAAPTTAAATIVTQADTNNTLYSFKVGMMDRNQYSSFLAKISKAKSKLEALIQSFPGDIEVAHLLETTKGVIRFSKQPKRKAWVTEEQQMISRFIEYLNLIARHGFPAAFFGGHNNHNNHNSSSNSNSNTSSSNATSNNSTSASAHPDFDKRRLQLYHIVAQFLLQNAQKSWRLLFAAALNTDDLRLIQLMLANNADIARPGSAGCSPLYIACQAGHLSVCTYLYAKGANINQNAKSGATPLDAAISFQHPLLVAFLNANGAIRGKTIKDGAAAPQQTTPPAPSTANPANTTNTTTTTSTTNPTSLPTSSAKAPAAKNVWNGPPWWWCCCPRSFKKRYVLKKFRQRGFDDINAGSAELPYVSARSAETARSATFDGSSLPVSKPPVVSATTPTTSSIPATSIPPITTTTTTTPAAPIGLLLDNNNNTTNNNDSAVTSSAALPYISAALESSSSSSSSAAATSSPAVILPHPKDRIRRVSEKGPDLNFNFNSFNDRIERRSIKDPPLPRDRIGRESVSSNGGGGLEIKKPSRPNHGPGASTRGSAMLDDIESEYSDISDNDDHDVDDSLLIPTAPGAEDDDDGPDLARQQSKARRDRPGRPYALERSMTAEISSVSND